MFTYESANIRNLEYILQLPPLLMYSKFLYNIQQHSKFNMKAEIVQQSNMSFVT